MRALVLDSALHLEMNYPLPIPGDGEGLIRVTQAGICSTDLHLMQGYMGFQGILGHEFVGLVEKAPDRRDLVGQRVVGEINATCGTCPTCTRGHRTHCPQRTTLGIDKRNGAFAEYLTLPLVNLHVVPPEIPDEHAVFVEPLAAACEINKQVFIKPTDSIIIIGDGKLGLLCAQVLQLGGNHIRVVGHHPNKLAILERRGIEVSVTPQTILHGADIVIETTGNPSGMLTAQQLVRPKGTIVLKSTYHGPTPVNLTELVIHEITLIGSRCGPFEPAIRLIQQGLLDLSPFIHARYSLNQAQEAFEHAKRKGTLKILLTMD